MAIHSGNPSIETWGRKAGQHFRPDPFFIQWTCRESNPLQKIALTCGNADILATRNDAKIRETTCGYAKGVDDINASKNDNVPRLTLTARVNRMPGWGV